MSMGRAIEEALADLINRIPAEGSVTVQIETRRLARPEQASFTGHLVVAGEDHVDGYDTEDCDTDDSDKFVDIAGVKGKARLDDAKFQGLSEMSQGGSVPQRGRPEPNLGCAQTQELLEELATRMDLLGRDNDTKAVWRMCNSALNHLPPAMLTYRTID